MTGLATDRAAMLTAPCLQHAADVAAVPIDVEALAADEERWQSEWEAIVSGATPVES